MVHLSHNYRDEFINELTTGYYDVLIIGGGILGAGIAVQAAASGMRTALIEKKDFASGTSSRSTKIIHGGLRYLLNGDIEVVSDLVSERAVVQQIAPHIPVEDPMLIPLYDEEDASFSPFRLKIAMNLYDSLGGVTGSQFENAIVTKDEVLRMQPNLKKEGLLGGGVFLDYNNDDTRLVMENIKQAHADGAIIANHAEVTGFVYNDDKKVNGVKVHDLITDTEFYVNARMVVNATGVWSDKVRKLDEYDKGTPQLRPTKGVHLVVDRKKLPLNQPVYIDSGEHDERMVFVIPRGNKTYFGTTDTDHKGDVESFKTSSRDVEYLLRVVNRRFEDTNISIEDVESSWVGLRPLIDGNNSSDYNGGDAGRLTDANFNHLVDMFEDYAERKISREEVEKALHNAHSNVSERNNPSSVSRGSKLSMSPSGIYTIAGGKLTDYRKISEGVIYEVRSDLATNFNRSFPIVNSKTYSISGGHFSPNKFADLIDKYAQEAVSAGLSVEDGRLLARHYGSNMDLVLSIVELAKPYAKYYEYPLSLATSLIYSLEYEATYSVMDYFERRTPFFHFNRDLVLKHADNVGQTIRDYLRLSNEEYTKQKMDFNKAIHESSLKSLK